jgi:hypothetical protein
MDDFLDDSERGGSATNTSSAREEEDPASPSTVELATLKVYPNHHHHDGSHSILPATAAASLPLPEEHIIETEAYQRTKTSEGGGGGRRRVIWIVVASVLVVVLLSVGISVGASKGNSSSRQSNNSSHHQSSKKAATRKEMANWVVRTGISSQSAVTTPGTPQDRAIEYLVQNSFALPDTDSLAISAAMDSGYMLAAHYVLAVIFYSTKGESWHSPLGFLKPNTHICNWKSIRPAIDEQGQIEFVFTGVTCDDDGLLYSLDLGTLLPPNPPQDTRPDVHDLFFFFGFCVCV